MNAHESFQELCALELYGELSAQESLDLREHRSSCGDCARFERELGTTLGKVAGTRYELQAAATPSELAWGLRLRLLRGRLWHSAGAFLAGAASACCALFLWQGSLEWKPGGDLPVAASLSAHNAAESPAQSFFAPPPRASSTGQLAQFLSLQKH